jgi:small subunit ribosomal protein S7
LNKKAIDIKLFDKWPIEDMEVKDIGLASYLSLKPTLLAHSGGRHEHQRFKKSTVNVVERLINNMMHPGKSGGKKLKALNIVKNALNIIHLKTKKNPIQILTTAIENSAPAEETTRIVYGGVAYPVAVDVAPQRRVDLALRFIGEGSRKAVIKNPKPIDEGLAEEIIFAADKDTRSFAVKRKDEIERIALSSR